MNFYVKKLYSNELGIRNGIPNKAGKFLLVSKRKANFFPLHNSDEVDPSMSLGIIINDRKHLVNAEYTYHNDDSSKHQGNDRRIYLNEEIDLDGSYFQPGYYIVFFKYNDEIDNETKYILYRFTPDHKQYDELEKITQKKNHLTFENLDFVNTSDKSYKKSTISKKTKSRISGRLARNVHDIYSNQPEFRYAIRNIYEDKCCITGESINTGDTINCEASHIMPWQSNGNHAAKNGLLLSRDFHWAFDRGCFTIDQSYEIRVHKKMKDGLLGKYEGKKIILPKDRNFWPSIKNITYHNHEVFGKFKEAEII
tara:strand:+ start:92 stop:1021 length:930 start_codon:yes stop_codon:yes gene_type:complete